MDLGAVRKTITEGTPIVGAAPAYGSQTGPGPEEDHRFPVHMPDRRDLASNVAGSHALFGQIRAGQLDVATHWSSFRSVNPAAS
jgi:hypothetical protein